jgi:hypothetical protein
MSQSISIVIALGANHAGLSDLRAQLIDTSGANVGSAVSTGFVVLGDAANGNYGWTGNVADNFQGFVNVYSLADPTIAACVVVNQITTISDADMTTIAERAWDNAYAPVRTLTQSAAAVAATVAGSDITILRGDTTTIALTGLGSLTNRTEIWFTTKNDLSLDDTTAVVQVSETGGLLYLNGASATTSTDASLTVSDANAGNLTIVLKASATKRLLAPNTMKYDVQIRKTDGTITTLTQGGVVVTQDVTTRIA